MDKDDVQTTPLPGVRTLKKDLEEEHVGVVLPKADLTTPGMPVELNHATADLVKDAGTKQLFDVESAYNENEVQVGTIVTDKRKRKGSIGALLVSAFKEWWEVTQTSVQKSTANIELLQKKEVPKIEAAESRKNIIQEAAQYAQQAPKDDHAIVVEKIKTLAKDAESVTGKPFGIKTTSPVSLTWQHTVEEKVEAPTPQVIPKIVSSVPLAPLAEISHSHSSSLPPRSPLASYAAEDDVPRSHTPSEGTPAFTVSPVIQKVSEKPLQKLVPKPVRPEQSDYMQVPTQRIDLRSLVETKQTGRIDESVITPSENESLSSERHSRSLPHMQPLPAPAQPRQPLKVVPEPPLPKPTVSPHLVSRPLPTPQTPVSHPSVPASHWVRNILLIFAIVVGTGLGIYAALIVASKYKEPDVVEAPITPVVPSLLITDAEMAFPLPLTRAELLEALATKMGSAPAGVTYFYPADANGSPSTGEQILNVLSPRTSGSFVRNLGTPLMFGVVGDTKKEPYMVLQFSNFDVAFAGMLEWEKTMSAELSPFFGKPITQTSLPWEERETKDAHFVDALKTNQTIRILYGEDGEERIVYGFVKNNIIVLTTSTEALSALISRIR